MCEIQRGKQGEGRAEEQSKEERRMMVRERQREIGEKRIRGDGEREGTGRKASTEPEGRFTR